MQVSGHRKWAFDLVGLCPHLGIPSLDGVVVGQSKEEEVLLGPERGIHRVAFGFHKAYPLLLFGIYWILLVYSIIIITEIDTHDKRF